MSALLLYGENSYLLRRELDSIVGKFKIKEGDMNLAIMDAKDSAESDIITACETPPFLGNARLTIVQNVDFKKSADALADFLEKIPESCHLIVTAKSTDARKKLFKAFKKFGTLKEFAAPKPAEFKKWLREEVSNRKLAIEANALDLLATYTLGNCEAAINELDKLETFSSGEKITSDDVKLLTHPDLHTSVFQLTDAIGERRIGNALADLRDIVNRGENLIQIFFMVVRQFRILLSLQALASRRLAPADIARELKLHPFVVQNSLRQMRNFSEQELLTAHTQLLDIDTSVKTGKLSYSTANPGEFALALEKFIVSFA